MDSPREKSIQSIMLLLPEPFGPEIVVNPSKKGIVVFDLKDLKLSISISLILICYLQTYILHVNIDLHIIYYTICSKRCQESYFEGLKANYDRLNNVTKN